MTPFQERSLGRLGPQGRIVVPAHFRRALDLEVGDALVASIDDGRFVLAPRETARARLLDRFPAAEGQSAVDELLAGRRADARRESAEADGADEPTDSCGAPIRGISGGSSGLRRLSSVSRATMSCGRSAPTTAWMDLRPPVH